jgi:hypothetical protein
MELTRNAILEADDLEIKQVETPEWGGHTFVRTLNADDSYRFNKLNTGKDGKVLEGRNIIVSYCALVICDSKGNRLFTETDIEKLSKKNIKALIRVYESGRELNGDNLEELEKNSEPTQSDVSTLG